MKYKLEFLPLALADILEIEASLYEYSPAASGKFTGKISRLTQTLTEHPFMYQVFEHDEYFRSMPLCYNYRLFYHAEKECGIIRVHRVIHAMRDLESVPECDMSLHEG